MTDMTLAPIKIMLKPDAAQFLQSIPSDLKCALIDFIRQEARRADKAMIVMQWTRTARSHIQSVQVLRQQTHNSRDLPQDTRRPVHRSYCLPL